MAFINNNKVYKQDFLKQEEDEAKRKAKREKEQKLRVISRNWKVEFPNSRKSGPLGRNGENALPIFSNFFKKCWLFY